MNSDNTHTAAPSQWAAGCTGRASDECRSHAAIIAKLGRGSPSPMEQRDHAHPGGTSPRATHRRYLATRHACNRLSPAALHTIARWVPSSDDARCDPLRRPHADRPLRRRPRRRAPRRPRGARRSPRRSTARAFPADEIEDVWLGCANQAGEDNRNVARFAALLAGLPDTVAGVTVNRLCASGLAAVVGACHAVVAGDGDLFVAGGVESMTRAPLVTAKPDVPFARGDRTLHDTTLGWRFVNPATRSGTRARRWARRARTWPSAGASRARTRTRSRPSRSARWAAAQAAGRFADELVPAGELTSRRAPAAGDDGREAGVAEAGVPRRRHGDGRQLERHQRRRGGARDRERGEGRASSGSSRSAASPAPPSQASTRP